jgi:cell division protein FtsI/penicillin-binding protein 2
LAAHILGFVNRSGEASEGVELRFDSHLQSIPGVKRARKDGHRQLLDTLMLEYTPPTGGDDVYLTIDTAVQHKLEQALDARMIECNAPAAMGIVMDPYTGGILAMATRPAFDPNRYDEYPAELRKNRAALDMFEPGSVFKIVTASAALEHGLITPQTLINCEHGGFNPYGHRIRDFYALGVEPFSVCFEQSSNVAIIKVAAMLGSERLEDWILRFGFGKRTCPDLQFEATGLFRPRKEWSRLSMGSLPMGQEIAATMLQLAKAFAVVANGGYVVEPYFVEQAVDRMGKITYHRDNTSPERILSQETAETMRALCHQVVVHGTGKRASIDEYRVGGKTGTAQMKKIGGRGYDPDRYTTVFAGFAPVNNPRVVAVIVVQEPKIKLRYGGYVCGPVFQEVVRETLIRMDVPNDPVDAKDVPLTKIASDVEGVDHPAVETVVSPEDPVSSQNALPVHDVDTLTPRVEIEQIEAALASVREPLDGLELVGAGVDGIERSGDMPDLTGLSKREARERLGALGIPWDPRGSGWVVAQDPAPGTPLSQVSLCAVEFSTRRAESIDENKGSS